MSNIPPSTASHRSLTPTKQYRIQSLQNKLDREHRLFENISHQYLLPPDEFSRSRRASDDTSSHSRSQSLPRDYDRSLEHTLDLSFRDKDKLKNTMDSMPKKHQDIKRQKPYEHHYDPVLTQKIKKAIEAHPDLSISEALIANGELTGSEISKYFRGNKFKGEKFSLDTLIRAVSTGQAEIVKQLLKAEGHGFTEEECSQWLDHAKPAYKEKLMKAINTFKEDPESLNHILSDTPAILRLKPEEIQAAAMAATPEQAQKEPDFMGRVLCLSGKTDWNTAALLIKKGAKPSFTHLADIMSTLVIKEKGNSLPALIKAHRIGLIPEPHQFLCELAHFDGLSFYSSFLGRKTDRPRQTVFEGLLKARPNIQKALLLKPNQQGESPISILRAQYKDLIPELQAFVDKFPDPRRLAMNISRL